MKLKTLAIAVAVASMPFAAQAELKISGDVGVKYDSEAEEINQQGSEINFDASETVNGITYYGHTVINAGADANLDEIRVGAKGGFGEVIFGDADNACDQLDIGGTNDWLGRTHVQGGCKGNDDMNIIYKRGIGGFTGAISHNPNSGKKNTALGLKGVVGPAGVSLGYEDFDSGSNNTTLGLTGKIGPFSVGFRGNKEKGMDAVHGINAIWSSNGHNVYGGLGTSDNNDSKSIGYKRVIGKTDIGFEWNDDDNGNDGVNIGMRHRF